MTASLTPPSRFKEKFLIESCIKGNTKSQKQLYEKYYHKMYSICYKYLKDKEVTEDIMQEAFIMLFKKLHTYKGEGSFEGWVRKIFVNTALGYLRARKDDLKVVKHIDSFYSHSNALDNLYEKDILKISMKLDRGYYMVFDLYTVKGYSHKEIAQLLGITESTSKSQLSRAKAKLRNMVYNDSIANLRCA